MVAIPAVLLAGLIIGPGQAGAEELAKSCAVPSERVVTDQPAGKYRRGASIKSTEKYYFYYVCVPLMVDQSKSIWERRDCGDVRLSVKQLSNREVKVNGLIRREAETECTNW
ncbi:hypothetical protein [Nocardia sp. SSK8]|uniref:hypothetical protein n=1 Tax=Nocardia sp. SSK8 TaxID=3120154 RepID=UPI00300B7894